MFRIEYLPVPAEFQKSVTSAPARHDLGADPSATAAAALVAQDAQKGVSAETAGGGVVVFLISVAAMIAYAMFGADKPGAGSAEGRMSDGVLAPKRPTSVGSLAGEAIDFGAEGYDDLFLRNRRHFDAEGKRLFDMVRENAGEEGFYAVLDGSRFRHGQEDQWEKNIHRQEDAELFKDLAAESGMNGTKRRSHRARRSR